ncbi:Uncharacterised protein [Serratia odorifera]|uniref:Uncharacterized protein n=1 Tax=Serratia odorifera TaxID=618 RepID=A0A3S4E801_SEROD|nr:Uncharacterised protein [Serratia odorifera]
MPLVGVTVMRMIGKVGRTVWGPVPVSESLSKNMSASSRSERYVLITY